MIQGLFATFLLSIAIITNKKAVRLKVERNISNMGYEMVGESILLLGLFILLLLSPFITIVDFDVTSFTTVVLLLLLGRKFVQLIAVNMYYTIFQKEKLSQILPMDNFDKFFTVLFGFLIFQDTSLVTLLFAIAAVCIMTLSQIDFKNFKPSSYLFTFVLIGLFKSMGQLASGYLLTLLSSYELLIGSTIVALIFMAVVVIKNHEISELPKKVSLPIIRYRSFDKFFLIIALLISYTLIQQLGLVTTLLISLFGYVSQLLLAFLVLRERPKIKEILVGMSILSCILAGTYFG